MDALHPLLEKISANPDNTDAALLAALVRFLRPRRLESTKVANGRLHALNDVLRSKPHLADGLRNYISSLLASRRHRFLYAESGILANTGFFTELRHRLGGRMLPPALDPQFLRDLVDELFDHEDDGRWLAAIPSDIWRELLAVFGFAQTSLTPGNLRISEELAEALRILACRLAALGLEPDLVRYHAPLAQHESPFLAQQHELENIVDQIHGALADTTNAWPDTAHAEVLLDQCKDALGRIRRQSRESGAAVKLSWHLTRATQMIERMLLILALLKPSESEEKQRAGLAFALQLVSAECRRNNVRDLITGVTDLLALQVTEHAGRTGEHYVTRGRAEFLAMFRVAAGAGVIVGFMALIKIFIAALHLPPLWEALGFSLNYGIGFVVVHLLGFTIATKQPAMTAATLAAALDPRVGGSSPLDEMTELIVQVWRSQFIAIAGNVLLGFATSLCIALAWHALFGNPPVSAEKAARLLHDLHPLLSLALPHAAIAGVCLFLAGLISGYYDNKAIYNRVPERLQRVKLLQKLLGTARLARVANYIDGNLGALAGNFLFGCMLGSIGTVGFMLGLPFDIRHVSFASTNLAYGMEALNFNVSWYAVLICIVGVLLVGLTNLGVSFSLAMRVALKSRRVRFAESRQLVGLLWQRFKRRPRDFFWPPREEAMATVVSDESVEQLPVR